MTKYNSKKRCVACDQDGKQCKKRKTVRRYYHGDPELYGWLQEKPGWVRVYFCQEHDVEKD